ncbi:PREDICTED: uncharacterized protein LOC108541943 [Rhinopithecus bieti]|uniref:uncharacterized protein LOC108541943 n=1 Tax=Rhinopithecus bieti TaxID=61621 RepID=UPI00083C7F84|nr:PREDICTED: uncharacterized protein LOC108541943 [Rhinopithecus bieti]
MWWQPRQQSKSLLFGIGGAAPPPEPHPEPSRVVVIESDRGEAPCLRSYSRGSSPGLRLKYISTERGMNKEWNVRLLRESSCLSCLLLVPGIMPGIYCIISSSSAIPAVLNHLTS